jgi:hypothetical protein
MSSNDEAARKARADRLHAQIEALKGKKAPETPPTQPAEQPEEASPTESPRDFVHRRMRELRDKESGA